MAERRPERVREELLTDTLVEPLIATVQRIKARADSKVTKELINAFKRASRTTTR